MSPAVCRSKRVRVNCPVQNGCTQKGQEKEIAAFYDYCHAVGINSKTPWDQVPTPPSTPTDSTPPSTPTDPAPPSTSTDPAPPSTPTDCVWLGHCLGDRCKTENDCDGDLICTKRKCATAKCAWGNHCESDPCKNNNDCYGELICKRKKCAIPGWLKSPEALL